MSDFKFNVGDWVVISGNVVGSVHRTKMIGKTGVIVDQRTAGSEKRRYYMVDVAGVEGSLDFWEDEVDGFDPPTCVSQKVEYALFDLPSELGKFWVVGVNRGTNEMWVVDNSGLDKDAAAHVVNALNSEVGRGH